MVAPEPPILQIFTVSLNWKNIVNLWINGPQFLYYSESEWEKFISYNNTHEKPTNLRSNKNDLSCFADVHVKSVRDLKEVFNLKSYNNFYHGWFGHLVWIWKEKKKHKQKQKIKHAAAPSNLQSGVLAFI